MTDLTPHTHYKSGGSETSSLRTSSLSWRLILPVPIAALIASAAIWFIVPSMVEHNVRDGAILNGQQIADQFKVIRGYYTQNVIKKVVKSKDLKPSFNHKSESNGVPLPATFIHDVSTLLSKKNTSVNLYSAFPFPNRSERQLDNFQSDAWAYLTRNPDSVFSRQVSRDGKQIVRVAIADKMAAQGCVDCHNAHGASPKTDWKLGDVRGVLEVASVIDDQLAAGASLSTKMIGATLAIGLILSLITIFFARRVTGPLSRMIATMKQLADGKNEINLDEVARTDEIGEMARAVGVFRDQAIERQRFESISGQEQQHRIARQEAVEKLIGSFRNNVSAKISNVKDIVDQIDTTTGLISSIAESTSERTSGAATASSEAAENVHAVAAAAEELTASIHEISRQTAKTSEVVTKATIAADDTDRKVVGLSDAAQKISEVVSLIQDIAEQTNLLALNATIEAARAGESGKGFAVVASEVKELATQTAKATEDIGVQIANIQVATDETVEAIKQIVETMKDVDSNTASIAAAVEQQGASTAEISRNVQDAASRTVTLSENISGATSSASETTQSVQQMAAVSKELATCTDDLNVAIDNFLDKVSAA